MESFQSKYTIYVELETGEKAYKPLSALPADDPDTYDTNSKENDLLPIEGCQWFKNLAKRDKPDLSCIASPKGEMKRIFTWTRLCKTPLQALYVLVNLHLERSIKKLSVISSYTVHLVTLLSILELPSLCQALPLKQAEFPTATPA